MDLKNKKAIVTGGLNGIGKRVGENLLEREVHVAVLDIAENQWANVRTEWEQNFPNGSFYFIKCNMCKREEVIAAFEKAFALLNGLDIVVNNAGIFDEANWEMSLDINFKAMMRVAYIGINLMSRSKGRDGGVVINSASLAGVQTFAFPAYCAGKSAVTAFTRSIAAMPDFIDIHGVRVNSVCVGFAQTSIPKQGDFKTSNDLDSFPGISLLNKAKDRIVLGIKYERMVPVDKVAGFYMKLIEDPDVHGKNLYYIGQKQSEALYHEFQGIV